MEELYVEGVATHGGPESCVVVREGGGEALTGARAGRGYRVGWPGRGTFTWTKTAEEIIPTPPEVKEPHSHATSVALACCLYIG